MQSATPFLWFKDSAEEAMRHYLAVVPGAKEVAVTKMGDQVLSVEFEILGQHFVALNGNEDHPFNESFSIMLSCDTQEEVDAIWDGLLKEGGEPLMCGWLKDKYGLTWQVIPKQLMGLISDPDPERSGRAMKAMLQMVKIDVAALEAAANGEA